jgi:hypothetical protein
MQTGAAGRPAGDVGEFIASEVLDIGLADSARAPRKLVAQLLNPVLGRKPF